MWYLELFLVFARVGFTSFGGMSMIPVINQEMLNHGWMTVTEIADIVAIAEMTPGPLGINCASFVGFRIGGIPGALVANLGVLVPTLTLTMLMAVLFEKAKDNLYWKRAMYAIRPVCLGMIVSAVFSLIGTNFWVSGRICWAPVFIAAVVGLLIWKTKLSIPLLIVIAGMLGFVIV